MRFKYQKMHDFSDSVPWTRCLEVFYSFSYVQLFATPWTAVYWAPLSMEFSRQEYWSGLPFPSPGDLPDPGIKPGSPALQADALPSKPQGKPQMSWNDVFNENSQFSVTNWPMNHNMKPHQMYFKLSAFLYGFKEGCDFVEFWTNWITLKWGWGSTSFLWKIYEFIFY